MIRDGGKNLLAVRVLNPANEPIDDIVLSETPHRNKVIPYRAGASYNHGGIVDSVELLVVPAVRIEDLFARPDTKTAFRPSRSLCWSTKTNRPKPSREPTARRSTARPI